MQCDCLKDSWGWFSHCLHNLSLEIFFPLQLPELCCGPEIIWPIEHLLGSLCLAKGVLLFAVQYLEQRRKVGNNHHIRSTSRKLSISYSTLALLPDISEGECGILFHLSDQILAFQESFVCLGFIDDFTLVNSIWYSDALLGVLKYCSPSNQKQEVLSVFALHVFSKICTCSKNISVVL